MTSGWARNVGNRDDQLQQITKGCGSFFSLYQYKKEESIRVLEH